MAATIPHMPSVKKAITQKSIPANAKIGQLFFPK